MIISHFVAALRAVILAAQYASTLNIPRADRVRYFKKSIRLALCFAGFATPWNLIEAWKAGEAAFFCVAYDVLTDWRHFDETSGRSLKTILNGFSQTQLYPLAMSLYDKEKTDKLADDGLERGAITLRFILKLMGREQAREASWGDLDALGQLLQIVDDVFDYEDDAIAGDQNCLTTANREIYLRRLLDDLSQEKSRRLFGRSVLMMAIAHARKKGRALLSNTLRTDDTERTAKKLKKSTGNRA